MIPVVTHRTIEVYYTEHCSVGPTNFIETIGIGITARLKMYGAVEDFG